MKTTALVSAAAAVAAIFTGAAQAQTGLPSALEVQAAAAAPRAAVADEDLGSYARYLMLNGATREVAIAAARNIDHPAARAVVASRSRVRADATARQ